jgi:hypothetical protein
MIDIKDVKPYMMNIFNLVGDGKFSGYFGNTKMLDHVLFNLSYFLSVALWYLIYELPITRTE